MTDLAVILTARLNSERLPRKALQEVKGKPLIYWIIQRFKRIKGASVVLAIPRRGSEELAEVAEAAKIPVFRGDAIDVVDRVDQAVRQILPDAKLVLRALGDMPFISYDILNNAVACLLANPSYEAFLWHAPPDNWPVYGAREFPYSRSGWDKIARRASGLQEREHTDIYFHANRGLFRILYHEPPHQTYYRPYRLEVDYPEDLEMIRAVVAKGGMLQPLRKIIATLDANPEIADINRERVEKTGPMTSFHYTQRSIWMRRMVGQSVLGFDGQWRKPLNGKQYPIFCRRGHLLGFAQAGTLYTADGSVQLEAGKVKCQIDGCGSSKIWELASPQQ